MAVSHKTRGTVPLQQRPLVQSPGKARGKREALAAKREQASGSPTRMGRLRGLAIALSTLTSMHLWLLVAVSGLMLRVRLLLPLWGQFALAVLLLAEGAFFVWKCCALHRVQQVVPVGDRPLKPLAWSRLVFERTLNIVDECGSWTSGRTPQEWLETWFLGNPLAKILRGNLQQWMAWAFYTKKWRELEGDERDSIEGMIAEFKERYGWSFAEGFDPEVRPIRLNFDPLKVDCHPLTYYAAFAAMHLATRAVLRCVGFVYVKPATGLAYFHYAPAQPSPTQTSEMPPALPIVFIHGMGAGLSCYVIFLWRLMVSRGREGFALELPEIAQAGSLHVLPPDTFASAVAEMLVAHRHKQACFVAHSYGTFAMSWIQRARSDIVAEAILMDPVCFHLSQPDVAYNFAYQKPKTLFSAAITSFVRRELFAANVLMRNFYWQHNVLWREELPARCVVMLSGNDGILNANFVRQYLEGVDSGSGKSCPVEVLWFDDFFHSALVMSRQAQLQIVQRT